MTDQETTSAPNGTEEQNASTQAETEATTQETAVTSQESATYSKEQVEKLVAKRLERDRAKQREAWEAEKAEAEVQATMGELEKAQKREEKLKAQLAEAQSQLESERRNYSLERQLQGKVRNVKASMRLIGDFTDDEGNADLEAFFAEYPEQSPTETTTTTSRGVNSQSLAKGEKDDINAGIRRAAGR